jgi:hypothetical protein
LIRIALFHNIDTVRYFIEKNSVFFVFLTSSGATTKTGVINTTKKTLQKDKSDAIPITDKTSECTPKVFCSGIVGQFYEEF